MPPATLRIVSAIELLRPSHLDSLELHGAQIQDLRNVLIYKAQLAGALRML